MTCDTYRVNGKREAIRRSDKTGPPELVRPLLADLALVFEHGNDAIRPYRGLDNHAAESCLLGLKCGRS